MKQDLDISNIESKPTVVLVSNQSEFDQLMQHLEKKRCVWRGGQKATEWMPNHVEPPFGIMIDRKILSWHLLAMISSLNLEAIPFPEYAAKYIKPKRPYPNRVVKSKYDAAVFDLKMAQTALDNRNKEIDGWVKQNNELRAERDRLKAEVDKAKESCRKTNSDKIELDMDLKEARQSIVKWQDRVIAVSNKMQTIRDQRDNARFAAVMFGLTSLGFAVAVLVGRLVPVY